MVLHRVCGHMRWGGGKIIFRHILMHHGVYVENLKTVGQRNFDFYHVST